MLMYRQLFGRIRTQLLPFRLVTTLWGASMHCCLSVDAKQPSIQPSHTEQKIFQLLKDVVRERHLRCELRVAGGWVRDKLYGLQCDDIDIAIDSMTGQQFCTELIAHLEQTNAEHSSSLGVVRRNPDQSKHLETACMRLYDHEIDFVNLRTETYSQESRIPTAIMGSVREDAFRRDFTINSLYYNLMTESIEDYTETGLDDLRENVLRTPLPPSLTFADDPLRALRAIRFISQFPFLEVESELMSALTDESLQELLRRKVSPERIGVEMRKLLQASSPTTALRVLIGAGMMQHIFPSGLWTDEILSKSLLLVNTLWDVCGQKTRSMLNKDANSVPPEALLAALLVPIIQQQKDKRLQRHCLKEWTGRGLRWPNKSVRLVTSSVLDSIELTTMLQEHYDINSLSASITLAYHDRKKWTDKILDNLQRNPVPFGLWLNTVGESWKERICLGLATLATSELHAITATESFISAVRKAGLIRCTNVKDLLTGHDIKKHLDISGGKRVGEVKAQVRNWLIVNKDLTKGDAIARLKEEI